MTPDAIAWVEQALGSRVVEWRRLTGGLTSEVHRVVVDGAAYVLRRWVPGELYDYGVRTVATESAALRALAATDLPAPRLIASTTDMILMTCVPGEMVLMPVDRDDWLRQTANLLARIHATKIDAKPFESWLPESPSFDTPLWRDAYRAAAKPAAGPTCFIHRDYQHFNLLWSSGRLTGVVDWVEASIGPPAIDVGHCRLNLAVLFSADIAERFRAMYEAEVGREVDPWWDLHALLSYGPAWKSFLPIQIDGRAPLDTDGMTSRMEDLVGRTLRRL
jgi:aminoglycoside phosphotransferase (APT) family kinase protein